MSQVFHGTIFSIPSTLKFDPEVEERKRAMREERDQLQSVLDYEGFKSGVNNLDSHVPNSSPIRRAIEKAMGIDKR